MSLLMKRVACALLFVSSLGAQEVVAERRWGPTLFKASLFSAEEGHPGKARIHLQAWNRSGARVQATLDFWQTDSGLDPGENREWLFRFEAYSPRAHRVWFTSNRDEHAAHNTPMTLFAWDMNTNAVVDLGDVSGTGRGVWPSPSGRYLLVYTSGHPSTWFWTLMDMEHGRSAELDDLTHEGDDGEMEYDGGETRYRWRPDDHLEFQQEAGGSDHRSWHKLRTLSPSGKELRWDSIQPSRDLK